MLLFEFPYFLPFYRNYERIGINGRLRFRPTVYSKLYAQCNKAVLSSTSLPNTAILLLLLQVFFVNRAGGDGTVVTTTDTAFTAKISLPKVRNVFGKSLCLIFLEITLLRGRMGTSIVLQGYEQLVG